MKWQTEVKHLGNVINNVLSEEHEILNKKQALFYQTNQLLADFSGIRHDIMAEVFSKKCSAFYGSQAWDLNSKYVNDFYTGWNKAARRILGLPYRTHRFLLPVLINCAPKQQEKMPPP